jgi:hypothetical protein
VLWPEAAAAVGIEINRGFLEENAFAGEARMRHRYTMAAIEHTLRAPSHCLPAYIACIQK